MFVTLVCLIPFHVRRVLPTLRRLWYTAYIVLGGGGGAGVRERLKGSIQRCESSN